MSMSDDMNDNELPATDRPDGQDEASRHKKHAVLWVAVGGVAACVIAVWVLLLPLQLQKEKTKGLSGWLFTNEPSVNGENIQDIWQETAQTFNQGINELKHQAKLDETVSPEPVNSALVERLRARIEEEAAKKASLAAEAAVSAKNVPGTLPASAPVKK